MTPKAKFFFSGGNKYEIKVTKTFHKEYQKALRQNKKVDKLIAIVEKLANGKPLPQKYRDHILRDSKKFKNCRECHIEPDWLLVYQIQDNLLILTLIETGPHAELFDK